jgi:hypothetical protein
MYSKPFGRAVLRPLAFRGYRRYLETDETPPWAFSAMRKLFAADPQGFQLLLQRSQHEHDELEGLDTGRGVGAGFVDEAVAQLRRLGVVVLPTRLGESECAALEQTALEAECTTTSAPIDAPARARFDPASPTAVRYDLDEQDVLACPVAQQLLGDQSLLAIAQQYLGAAPVQDMVAMWWSTAQPVAASSAAAQLFHFDLDRLRFLKLFVYLTDVDAAHGPHLFVRGSHRDLPAGFRHDRRYTDDEVFEAFGDAVMSIEGRRGTMFLADTRGLHKGLPLEHGIRLVFQLEYATSLFGYPVRRLTLVPDEPAAAAAMAQFPYTFRRFVHRES